MKQSQATQSQLPGKLHTNETVTKDKKNEGGGEGADHARLAEHKVDDEFVSPKQEQEKWYADRPSPLILKWRQPTGIIACNWLALGPRRLAWLRSHAESSTSEVQISYF
jgi:hypothetical protein